MFNLSVKQRIFKVSLISLAIMTNFCFLKGRIFATNLNNCSVQNSNQILNNENVFGYFNENLLDLIMSTSDDDQVRQKFFNNIKEYIDNLFGYKSNISEIFTLLNLKDGCSNKLYNDFVNWLNNKIKNNDNIKNILNNIANIKINYELAKLSLINFCKYDDMTTLNKVINVLQKLKDTKINDFNQMAAHYLSVFVEIYKDLTDQYDIIGYSMLDMFLETQNFGCDFDDKADIKLNEFDNETFNKIDDIYGEKESYGLGNFNINNLTNVNLINNTNCNNTNLINTNFNNNNFNNTNLINTNFNNNNFNNTNLINTNFNSTNCNNNFNSTNLINTNLSDNNCDFTNSVFFNTDIKALNLDVVYDSSDNVNTQTSNNGNVFDFVNKNLLTWTNFMKIDECEQAKEDLADKIWNYISDLAANKNPSYNNDGFVNFIIDIFDVFDFKNNSSIEESYEEFKKWFMDKSENFRYELFTIANLKINHELDKIKYLKNIYISNTIKSALEQNEELLNYLQSNNYKNLTLGDFFNIFIAIYRDITNTYKILDKNSENDLKSEFEVNY